ncbi:hypothetical protein EDB81DRAFT_751685 [Dactylonectria macrodidyma]|uniref:Uncharacterized protein n=1 Tax=Dactylonectria macrodidyma TaxID=307937 RepID=A0A9P9FTR3_9HYPO|nr:hypothetical protein EDB81DRAFT_751685 [Dactylonectria macrodidyma]
MPSSHTEQHRNIVEQHPLDPNRHPRLLKHNHHQANPSRLRRAASPWIHPLLNSDVMANNEEKKGEGLTKDDIRRINETLSNQSIIEQLSRTGIAAQNKRAMWHGRFKRLQIEEMEKKMKHIELNNGDGNTDSKEVKGNGGASVDNKNDKGDGVGNVSDKDGHGEEAKDNSTDGSNATFDSNTTDGSDVVENNKAGGKAGDGDNGAPAKKQA